MDTCLTRDPELLLQKLRNLNSGECSCPPRTPSPGWLSVDFLLKQQGKKV